MKRREFIALVSVAAAWPRLAFAQSGIYRVGLLTLEAGETASELERSLRELGYVAGKNLHLEFRGANGDPGRLAALANEVVQSKPDVLVAGWGTLAPKALKAATSAIPIVFTTVGDPIGSGLVQSLARPGGNLTGLSGIGIDIKSKQLQLLSTCIPGSAAIGVLLNPDTPYAELARKELKAAADSAGIRLEFIEVQKPADFTAQRMDALAATNARGLLVVEDPLTSSLKTNVVDQASRLKLATMTGLIDYPKLGGLMAYGASTADSYRRVAAYVDKILKGSSPTDLPVEQPTKLQLVINLKTARAIGIAIPAPLLALADEVIE